MEESSSNHPQWLNPLTHQQSRVGSTWADVTDGVTVGVIVGVIRGRDRWASGRIN